MSRLPGGEPALAMPVLTDVASSADMAGMAGVSTSAGPAGSDREKNWGIIEID